ncbi:unnamed protein product [Rotaria magnacalcarata]|uniref:Uncharacterized protein n=1 Tax=Rotaria magnacalcarata TaxID=392030 RepID=A0A819PA58_9BILA|nr:unnamed protein product [Rotaria magnacalcarata]CAF4007315.1 unnamed protein product [Rotaria magnacalcarata]
MNFQSVLNKQSTLVGYAVEINHHSPLKFKFIIIKRMTTVSISIKYEKYSFLCILNRRQRQIIDSSEGFLTTSLNLTTQKVYVIRDKTKKIEYINLLSIDSSSSHATYTAGSLLISYTIPNDNIQRKFLIKLTSTIITKTVCDCEEYATLLSSSINVTHFDLISSSMQIILIN